MIRHIKRLGICTLCVLLFLTRMPVFSFAVEDAALITDFNSLVTAVQNAKDGDTLLVGDIDFSPLSPDVPNSMMNITVQKSLTIKSGKTDGAALFLNGGFVLSGSKLMGDRISVRFENIIFDGKAVYDALTEKDYEYPWNDAVQEYTYNASLKAQQALSFMGNVDADFSGCVFRNYMHEYGPVIDIRYADYTGNEYITLPDYSGCSLNLNFENCRIEKNSAFYDGGAVYIEANNNVVLNATNCLFSDNRSKVGDFSRGGGAVWASGATLNFTDCVLEKNIANYVYTDSVLFEYDTHKGGALCLEACRLSLVNSIIRENCASVGGAISMTNTKADIDGCRFTANRAEHNATNSDALIGPWSNMGMGGALYVEGNNNDTITLINCEIKDNFAVNAYGGIYGYYVPFEDPSLPTYNIEMILCTYEENRDDVDYDYSTVGDLAWLSHPGDMFANPHLTMRGCCIIDETFETDFPHNDSPTAENSYCFLAPTGDVAVQATVIPLDVATGWIGDRYDGRLTDIRLGSNYTDALYREEAETEPETEPETDTDPTMDSNPMVDTVPVTDTDSGAMSVTSGDETGDVSKPDSSVWGWLIHGVLLVGVIVGATVLHIYMRRRVTSDSESPADSEDETELVSEPIVTPPVASIAGEPQRQIVMTRYGNADIDRFIALVPETQLLTGRELEVLREILRGKKQGEVAYYLGIEVSTVKDHYKKIYAKLQVANKEGLLAKASEILKFE